MKKFVTYFIAAILLVSTLYPQDEEKMRQVQNFKDKYSGELSIQWDKPSGGPKRIIGNNIYLKSRLINKNNIQDLTNDFINENGDLLNIGNTELKMENITELENKFIISYQQLYKNIPICNVKLKLKIASNGQVLIIKSPCFDNPNISTQPQITLDDVKKNAASNFNIDIKEIQDGKLLIYPERESGKLYLCWHIKIEGDRIDKGLMVDAQTGQKMYEYDLYRNAEIKGTVRTTTWSLPGQTDGSPDITPYCQDLMVNVAGVGSANTNSSGYFSITVPNPGGYMVSSILDGPHCWVTNYAGSEASYSNFASTTFDNDWSWNVSEHYNEYFVFHYMNNVWHEFINKVSGFYSNYWYTNKMEGIANYGTGVNGSASGTWMGITISNHYGGSVYHEYSHNVNYRANGYWLGDYYYGDGYAMDEGLADYYSCSFRDDPLRYAVSRRLDTKMKYPGSGGAHTRGQIIGGACWDLASKSGMSLSYVNALVYEAVVNMGYEETFGDFMDEILSADDNDGNIFNGTPHANQICDAFVNDHAILGSYLAGNISSNITVNKNIIVVGDITVTNGYTLTISSGFSLNFHNGTTLNINGHLQINGTSGNNVVLNSSSGSWYGIVITNGGSTDIDYANIQNATTGVKFESGSAGSVSNSTLSNNAYGIYISGAEPTIESNTISSNSYGIYVTNSYSPSWTVEHIKNNSIQSNSAYGIYLYNSSPTLSSNSVSGCNNGTALFTNCNSKVYDNDFVSNSSYGFACYGSSSPSVYYNTNYSFGGYNSVLSNGSDEVRITGSSNPNFGNYFFDGNNSFDDNSGYLMYNSTGSTISAENNWWGSSSGPGVNQIYGSVDYDPFLDEDPNNPNRAVFIDNPSLAVSNINSTEDLSNAFNAYYGGNFTLAASLFKEYLNQNPKSENALMIIQYYLQSLNMYKSRTDMLTDFNILLRLKLNYNIRNEVISLYAAHLELNGNYDKALLQLELLLGKETEGEFKNRIKLQKAYLLINSKKDTENAKALFEEVLQNVTKESYLFEIAAAELNNLSNTKSAFPQALAKTTDLKGENRVVSLKNYPNPFNAETIIKFNLANESGVEMVVYNILGQKIAMLVNDKLPAGQHSVKLNAVNFTSGIYFVTLRTGSELQTIKISLLK